MSDAPVLDHIGVAVESIETGLAIYRSLGIEVCHIPTRILRSDASIANIQQPGRQQPVVRSTVHPVVSFRIDPIKNVFVFFILPLYATYPLPLLNEHVMRPKGPLIEQRTPGSFRVNPTLLQLQSLVRSSADGPACAGL